MNAPIPTDRATAEAFVAEQFDADPTLDRDWLARHRPGLVRQAASLAMLARQEAEWRAGKQIKLDDAA